MCGKSDLEGTGGIIQSPNYPHLFPSDVKCSWLIKVKDDEQILLMIEDLDVGISGRFGGFMPIAHKSIYI